MFWQALWQGETPSYDALILSELCPCTKDDGALIYVKGAISGMVFRNAGLPNIFHI